MKIYFILTALAVWAFAFSSPLLSQVDGVWFRTVIKAEDAAGNIDTVVFYVKEGATKGIDAELGEINLYGREPQGDLDIRIIRRTTETGKWLDGDPAPAENIDLKVNYRFYDSAYHPPRLSTSLAIVLKVAGKHYPVSIYLVDIKGICPDTVPNCTHYTLIQYREEDIKSIPGTVRQVTRVTPPLLLYTFNEPSDNNLIWFRHEASLYTSIIDVIHAQQPLFPNPSKDYVIIENGRIGERFEVLNTEGRIISSLTIETYPFKLDISNLAKGTYFLRNSEGITINKFIKE